MLWKVVFKLFFYYYLFPPPLKYLPKLVGRYFVSLCIGIFKQF